VFRQALQELGWADGRNVRVETRGAAGVADKYRSRPSSSWSSTPRPPGCSASPCRRRCSPSWSTFDTQLNDVQEAARAVGQPIHVLRANSEREIDAAFDTAKEIRASAMMVGLSTFFTFRRDQIVGLAARHALPTIYGQREFMAAGGLMSYATNVPDAYRQAGVYSGKILGGARPAELPVVQSAKFELLINLKVATSLGLTISPGLLAIADEVIE
jgi:putative tryptophan/tyrosine transport system substrate-binding protein